MNSSYVTTHIHGHTHVWTCTHTRTQVDPTCQYKDIVHISGFDSTFQLAGGINLPKVLSCIGSDGKRRRQLIKGRDDLRQDAVMQQVFVLVNQLLQKDPATSKRHLNIRTYRVCHGLDLSSVLAFML